MVDCRSYQIRLGVVQFSNQIIYRLVLIDFSSGLFSFFGLHRNPCGPCCLAHPSPWGQGTDALFVVLAMATSCTRFLLPAMSCLTPTSHPVPCTARASPANWSPELWRHSSEGLIGKRKPLIQTGNRQIL
jgi:hypothetical protein